MGDSLKQETVYLEPAIHAALCLRADATARSLSEVLNEALTESLREDEEDLRAFEERAAEECVSYEALLEDLRAHGKV